MFIVEAWWNGQWKRADLNFYWMPGPAVTAARAHGRKAQVDTRVVEWPEPLAGTHVILEVKYEPPPRVVRDIAALTKEVFG